MKFLIITSTEDLASMNIRERLLESDLFHFKEIDLKWHDHPLYNLVSITFMKDRTAFFEEHQVLLGITDSPLIFLDDLKLEHSNIKPDFLIFASRHRSETARPAFLIHATGNWSDKADFGGKGKKLSRTSAFLVKAGFQCLKRQVAIPLFEEISEFALDIEVTHHGPTTLQNHAIFMELGSSEKEWEIEQAGNLVARAIIETCFNYIEIKQNEYTKVGIGFGGTHYAPQFRKLIEQKNVAVSFICPKYYIQELDKKMIEQMIYNTLEKVDYFIVDWKGTNSQDKQHLLPLLEEFDIPIKKTKEL